MHAAFASRFPLLVLALVLAGSGCPQAQNDCSDGTCVACNADVDCSIDERCVEGLCRVTGTPTPDAPEPAAQEPEPVDGGQNDGGQGRDGGQHPLPPDAGTDAGPSDAGPLDAGPGDAGPLDAGPGDAGPLDAGLGDAGPLDAGPPAPVILAQVMVTAGIDPIGANEVVRIRLDHAGYVEDGLTAADGHDLHLMLDGVSLNRSLALSSSWGRSDTELWVAFDSAVAVDESVTLLMVSDGNSPPPDSLAELAIDLDTFDDGELSDRFVRSINGQNVSMEEEDGRFVVTMSEDEADAAIVVARSPLPDDRRFFIQHKIQLNRLTGGGTMNIKTIGVVQWPEQPTFAPTNNLGENVRQRVVLNHGGEDFFRSYAYCRSPDGPAPSWTGEGFDGDYEPWGSLPFHNDHIFEMESDSEQVVMRVRQSDGALIMETDPLPWDAVKHLDQAVGEDQSFGPYWYYFGEVYSFGEPGGGGPYYTADFSSDWIVHIRPAPPQTLVEIFAVR